MSLRVSRIVLSCVALSAVSACGQKGPLYLPDKPGQVITRPAGEQTEAPPETAPQPGTASPVEESKPTDQNKPK